MFLFYIAIFLLLCFLAGFMGLAVAILIWWVASFFRDPYKPPRKYGDFSD